MKNCKTSALFNQMKREKYKKNAEFSVIDPKLLDLDLEDSDNMGNATALLIIIDKLLLPNKQFYEICSQWVKSIYSVL